MHNKHSGPRWRHSLASVHAISGDSSSSSTRQLHVARRGLAKSHNPAPKQTLTLNLRRRATPCPAQWQSSQLHPDAPSPSSLHSERPRAAGLALHLRPGLRAHSLISPFRRVGPASAPAQSHSLAKPGEELTTITRPSLALADTRHSTS
jgi:hypothetical protein